MPASHQGKVRVTCPHCGHQQLEPRSAFSSNCRACGQYLRVEELLKPERKATPTGPDQKTVRCFNCDAVLQVPATAESTMCKHCSGYVDLKDYRITSAVSKNFRTKGAFVVEAKGYVFNTEALVGDAVLKGRFLGKLKADRLTIHSSAQIKGSFEARQLIIPANNHFLWPEPLYVETAEIAGELVADLIAETTATLRSSGRLFGKLESRQLIVEEGAILVGAVRIGLDVARSRR